MQGEPGQSSSHILVDLLTSVCASVFALSIHALESFNMLNLNGKL